MPTELIRCPSCNAADTSITDANGINQCVYCGVRYRLKGPASAGVSPVMVVTQPQGGSSPQTVAIVAVAGVMAMLLIGAVAAGALFFVGVSESPPPPEVAVVQPAATAPPPVTKESPPAVTSTRTYTPPPASSGPLSSSFEHHRTINTSIGSQYVLGYVTNTSASPLGKVKVNVVLIGEDGEELAVEHGYATRDMIEPGARVPVKVLLKDPPAYKELRYEVVNRPPLSALGFVDNLRVEAGEPRNDFGSSWKIDGKVFNDGDQAAQFISIEAAAVDKDGKLLGVQSSYADAKRLEPGASSRFSVVGMQLDEAPDHFEFSIAGRPAS